MAGLARGVPARECSGKAAMSHEVVEKKRRPRILTQLTRGDSGWLAWRTWCGCLAPHEASATPHHTQLLHEIKIRLPGASRTILSPQQSTPFAHRRRRRRGHSQQTHPDNSETRQTSSAPRGRHARRHCVAFRKGTIPHSPGNHKHRAAPQNRGKSQQITPPGQVHNRSHTLRLSRHKREDNREENSHMGQLPTTGPLARGK
mmetsp:Transcript_1891/g.6743  ORF Transcript_1891/g.6743 Transcript_1891/m.6743 type:complete len:202 (+) Transcript_1891:7989-8594(+)